MTLRPHHLPLLHHVHRTLINGAVGLVSQPVLVALRGVGGGGGEKCMKIRGMRKEQKEEENKEDKKEEEDEEEEKEDRKIGWMRKRR